MSEQEQQAERVRTKIENLQKKFAALEESAAWAEATVAIENFGRAWRDLEERYRT